jgi:hypothetical protein
MTIEPGEKARLLYELSLNGYVLLPAFLPPELIAAMWAQLEPIYHAEIGRAARGESMSLRGKNRLSVDLRDYLRHLRGPLDDDRFRRHPFVEEIATAVLGRWRYGVTKAECPLRDAEMMAWHADLAVEETGPRDRAPRPRRLTFNVALTAMDEGNGPMEVIPGSHRMHHDQTARWIGVIETVNSVTMLMRPGDCLLRDGNLLHRGTTNATGRPRILLDQTYRAVD